MKFEDFYIVRERSDGTIEALQGLPNNSGSFHPSWDWNRNRPAPGADGPSDNHPKPIAAAQRGRQCRSTPGAAEAAVATLPFFKRTIRKITFSR
jgi:hypothetical protein